MKENIIIENNAQSEDFISLSTLKSALADFFRFIFKSIRFLFSAINSRKFLFTLCCAIGLLAGYFSQWINFSLYSTEMIIHSNSLARKDYAEILENLNLLVISKSYSDFASELKVDDAIANKIKSIEAINLQNESLRKDTFPSFGVPFKITVKTTSDINTSSLQTALLNYLNNNQYISRIYEGQKRIYLEKLQFINGEQQRLDSLKEIYNRMMSSMRMPATFYNNALNPAELYEHSLVLAKQKEDILTWLNNESQPAILVDGFKRPSIPHRISTTTLTLLGLFAGVVLGFFITLMTAISKKFVTYQ